MQAADVVGLGAVLVAFSAVGDTNIAERAGSCSVVGDVVGTGTIEAPKGACSSGVAVDTVGLTAGAGGTGGGGVDVVP